MRVKDLLKKILCKFLEITFKIKKKIMINSKKQCGNDKFLRITMVLALLEGLFLLFYANVGILSSSDFCEIFVINIIAFI